MADPLDLPPLPPPSPRRKRRYGLWLLLVLLIAAAAWWGFGRSPDPAPTPSAPTRPGMMPNRGPGVGMATPVRVQTAAVGQMDIVLRALGTATAYNTVTVRSRVEGELLKIAFKEGQMVKAGDLLAQVDPRSYQVQLAQAEGNLQQNRAQLDNARKDLQRYETLFAQDSIARQQVDTQAALVRQYEGTLKTNQAAVDHAKLQLDYTRITAPIAGRLGLRQVDQGNMISSGDANGLVIITQTQPISVVFSLPEANLANLLPAYHSGQPLKVVAYDRADLTPLAEGVLDTLDNQIDTATGTLKMKARFDNADNALFPNQFVNVRLHLGSLKDLVIAPSAAVMRGTPGAYMFVVDDNDTVRMRVLDIAMDEGDRVAVRAGLKPGDRYVVEGLDRLREGARVTVQGAAVATPAPPPGEAVQAAQTANPGQNRRPRQNATTGTNNNATTGPRPQ